MKETKYLYSKYKIKNDILTELIMRGGAGYGNGNWYYNNNFKVQNRNLVKNVILSTKYSEPQFAKYHEMLNNMLVINNGIINLDFIEKFHRFIYYDEDDLFEIKNNGNKYIFVHPENVNYEFIELVISQDNTAIYFLKHKNPAVQKQIVMKVFTTQEVKISEIKDYMSLEIFHIFENEKSVPMTIQDNYISLSKKQFNKTNFNGITNLIKSQPINGSPTELYLGCKNNNAINEYIVNLILQQLELEGRNLNYVKYHGLHVIKINGEYKYCLFMDVFDGSLKEILRKVKSGEITVNPNKATENTSAVEIFILKLLTEMEKSLNAIKTPDNLFTHTDMKLENAFYKLTRINDDTYDIEKNGTKYIVTPYIADFDKASITYNDIRFYNNQTYINSQSGFVRDVLIDKTTQKDGEANKNLADQFEIIVHDDENDDEFRDARENANDDTNDDDFLIIDDGKSGNLFITYRISGIGSHRRAVGLSPNIETEQLYMRYNYLPYYVSFDMFSLILSLFALKLYKMSDIDERNETNQLHNFLGSYIVKNMNDKYVPNIKTLYTSYSVLNAGNDKDEYDYGGNFGELIKIIMSTHDYAVKQQKLNYNFDKKTAKKIYCDKIYRKLCMSIPFNYTVHYNEAASTLWVQVLEFAINGVNTQKYYDDLYITNKKIDMNKIKLFVDTNVTYRIEYTGDRTKTVALFVPNANPLPDKLIVRKNRSSSAPIIQKAIGQTFVYDYVEIQKDEVMTILEFFDCVV